MGCLVGAVLGRWPVSVQFQQFRKGLNPAAGMISVVADGVNDLALKRAEYEKIISDKGYDSLLGEIQAKISEMQVKS